MFTELELKKKVYMILSNVIISALEDSTPVSTGEMKRSWYLIDNGEFSYTLINDAEHSNYIDAGTGIYKTKGFEKNYASDANAQPIRPKTKKALAFKYNGESIVVKSVKGIKPRKILSILISEKLQNDLDREFEKLFSEKLKYVFG